MLHALILAAGDPGSQVGQNLGNMLRGLSQPIFLGLVGLVALALLAGRQVNKLVVFIGVALVVGMIVMNPGAFGNIAKAVGDALSKGV